MMDDLENGIITLLRKAVKSTIEIMTQLLDQSSVSKD